MPGQPVRGRCKLCGRSGAIGGGTGGGSGPLAASGARLDLGSRTLWCDCCALQLVRRGSCWLSGLGPLPVLFRRWG